MPSMKHHGKILDRSLPHMEGEAAAAFLDDFAVSDDPDKPITAGLFRLEAGEAMTYTYTYHEIKLIVDGEFDIHDADSDQTVRASRGDLFYFPEGSTITFTTPDFGLGYFCGQRGPGEA
ncbi:MAG: cupin domain-containing protein [Acidimicrobiales bacterium]